MKKLYAAVDKETHKLSDTFGVIAEYNDATLAGLIEDIAPRIPHRMWERLDVYCIGEVDDELNVNSNDYHLVANLCDMIVASCEKTHNHILIIESLHAKEKDLS